MKERVCTSCGFVGKPVNQCFESFLVDMFVWLIVSSVVFMTGLLPLFAISISWTVFHIAKFRNTKCPNCQNLDMVSMKSTRGKTIMQDAQHQPSV